MTTPQTTSIKEEVP